MKWLRVDSQRHPLRQGETTIGRSPYCSIQLVTPQTSREHAAILVKDGETTLTDLGSRNGTYLNGKRLQSSTHLSTGDRITIGGINLVVTENRAVVEDAAHTQEQILAKQIGSLETTTPDLVQAGAHTPRSTLED